MPSASDRQIYKMSGIYAIIMSQLSNADLDLLQTIAEFHHRSIKDTITACLQSEHPYHLLKWWENSSNYLTSLPSDIKTMHRLWTLKVFMLLKKHRESTSGSFIRHTKSYVFGKAMKTQNVAESILTRDYPETNKPGIKYWWVRDKDDPKSWIYFFSKKGLFKGYNYGAILVMTDLDTAQLIPNPESVITSLGPTELKKELKSASVATHTGSVNKVTLATKDVIKRLASK